MAIAQVNAGDRINAADLNQFYALLKGVAASGESITLIYNTAGVLVLQPSSDPAAGTELIQIKNNAGTVQSALSSDGRFYPADGLVGTPGIAFEGDKDTGLFRTGANDMSLVTGGTDRIRINTSGEIGVGVAPVAGQKLAILGNIDIRTGNFLILRNATLDANVLINNSGGAGVSTLTISAANGMALDGVLTVGPGAAGGKVIVTGTITAGGLLANGLQVGTSGPLIYSGSGAPSISAAVKGSLYLRSDGTTTNDRIYVAKDTAGTWASLTSAS